MTYNILYAIVIAKHIFQIIESESSTSDMDEFLRYYRLRQLEQYLLRYVILFGIYSSFENRSFLKSMLLNHTQTIEKAGGRKTDVDEYNWDERLLSVDRSVFLFLQREEEWEKQKYRGTIRIR